MLHTRIAHAFTPRGAVIFRAFGQRPLRQPSRPLFKTATRRYNFSTNHDSPAETPLPAKNINAGRSNLDGVSTAEQPQWLGVIKRLKDVLGINPVSGRDSSSSEELDHPNEDVLSYSADSVLLESPVPGPWDLVQTQVFETHIRKITLSSYLLGTRQNARNRAITEFYTFYPRDTETWAEVEEVE